MEFTVVCPRDGRVEVGFEDVMAVSFVGPEQVEVVFACPVCGSPLRTSLTAPSLLLAALELAQDAIEGEHHRAVPSQSERESGRATEKGARGGESRSAGRTDGRCAAIRGSDARERLDREHRGEPYCEYFRRQLAHVECVEDFLAQCE